MSDQDLDLFDEHMLVLGYDDLVSALLDELSTQDELLVVTPDPESVRELTDRGINAFAAEPDDEESLQRAGIERARTVIVATADDSADALTILTVRQLNPEVNILAVATNRENIRKLETAGADTVISPAVIAAKELVQAALHDDIQTDPDLR